MEGIRYWIETEGTGHWFFIAFPVALLCLFIWFKGRRVRFLIPSLLISIVIINPLFYKYWDKLGLYAYWRILWVVPVIPVVAALAPSISERIQKPWVKAVVIGTGVGLIVITGTFLYNGAGGSFVEAANAAKLPDYVVQIADRLLELDEHPRVIAQDPIGVYIRQYTGKIDTLYGRDIEGPYIWEASNDAVKTFTSMNSSDRDLADVNQLMLNDDYDYLIYSADPGKNFELIDTVGDYGIYRALGVRSVDKERNELGQVISATTVNEQGEPENSADGYAKVSYAYDSNGYVSYEFHTDADGNGVPDEYGIAGCMNEYDRQGHVLMESTLGIDGEPILAFQNYAEVRRTYHDGNLVYEAYYDEIGNPLVQLAGYTAFENTWDQDRITSRKYLGDDGQLVNRVDGYSTATWIQDENDTWSVIFTDLNNNIVDYRGINLIGNVRTVPDGWSEWMTPVYDTINSCFVLDYVNLGRKQEGDSYTCQLEIEFKDVSMTDGKQFLFQTQGDVDHKWDIKNVWYPNVVHLIDPPKDGAYCFKSTVILDKFMAQASAFQIAFRCDNWASGSFRIRNVKIEKGSEATEWSPGLQEGSKTSWSNIE